jgi:D-glycero-D-manno-heptose 1,7-bisphosphate phosphatase
MAGRQALFLDRDGTIIPDFGYPNDPEKVYLLPGVARALLSFKERGFSLILISNQSGIGRGLISTDEAKAVHNRVLSLLDESGVALDAAYYCVHGPDEKCLCRKPSPEMILRAAREFDIDLAHSFMIGDREVDVETGKNAGCRTILLRTGPDSEGCKLADHTADSWQEIAEYVR